MIDKIRGKLFNLAEENYKRYLVKIVPGVDNIIGVRMGKVRQIFKEYIYPLDNNELGKFASCDVVYLEEFLLQGMAVALFVRREKNWSKIDDFVQKINNWAVCDTFCGELKFLQEDKNKLWNYLQRYFHSDKEYEIRFAYVMFIFCLMDKQYINDLHAIADNFFHPGYYAKMSVAWALAEIYLNFPNESIAYLTNSKLDNDTYRKTIRKILESRKCKSKDFVKTLSIRQTKSPTPILI